MALTSEHVTLVPKGRNESSQPRTLSGLETPRRKIRLVGYGMTDRIARRIGPDREQSPAPRITPYPTGRVFFGPVPAPQAFGAGYLHLVPSGQKHTNL